MERFLLILIGGHFATAPRPQKEAAAAITAGMRVKVLGTWWDKKLALEDRDLAASLGVDFSPVVDLTPNSHGVRLIRLRQRVARELQERFGITTPRSFGTGGPEMLAEAIRLRADLTMVHSEAGLWVAEKLLNRGYRVGVDFEDWFSEDLPPSLRKGRPIKFLKQLERKLLSKAHLTLSTTQTMGEALAGDAGTNRIPLNIPNAFPSLKGPRPDPAWTDPRDPNAVSFYWFSQTIGPGRGLEALARSLVQLRGPWELHLRGDLRSYTSWFEDTFPRSIRSRIHVHSTVTNAALPWHTSSHDVGLALEVPHCASRDLTATNKIFEYFRSGLAVIASNTRGQHEVLSSCMGAGWLIYPDDSRSLAGALQSCIDDPVALKAARLAALESGQKTWAWEGFKPMLGNSLLSASSPVNPSI